MIIGVTGHRPKYMPCKYDELDRWAIKVKSSIRPMLESIQPDALISGMALGWDMWMAEAALELGIPLHCYLPYPGQGSHWHKTAKERFYSILERSSKLHCTSGYYSKSCYFDRDKEVVNDSDFIMALWSGFEGGGTYYTLKYAKDCGKDICNFWGRYDEDDTWKWGPYTHKQAKRLILDNN